MTFKEVVAFLTRASRETVETSSLSRAFGVKKRTLTLRAIYAQDFLSEIKTLEHLK